MTLSLPAMMNVASILEDEIEILRRIYAPPPRFMIADIGPSAAQRSRLGLLTGFEAGISMPAAECGCPGSGKSAW